MNSEETMEKRLSESISSLTYPLKITSKKENHGNTVPPSKKLEQDTIIDYIKDCLVIKQEQESHTIPILVNQRSPQAQLMLSLYCTRPETWLKMIQIICFFQSPQSYRPIIFSTTFPKYCNPSILGKLYYFIIIQIP